MHPSEEEDSRLISSEGPINRRTALKKERRLDAEQRTPPAHLQERIQRVHMRTRFGRSLVEHLAASPMSAQKPASGGQIAFGVIAACGAVLALLGAIQSFMGLLAAGIAIAACGALGWKVVHDKSSAADKTQAGAQPPLLFDLAALATFDSLLEKAAADLDDESASRLLAIKEAFKRIGNQTVSHDEHFTVEDRMYLRECLRRYIPDSVEAYLHVPAAQRREALLDGQPCAQAALLEQLDLLLEEIRLREKKIGRSAAEQLVNQQRFLVSKKSR